MPVGVSAGNSLRRLPATSNAKKELREAAASESEASSPRATAWSCWPHLQGPKVGGLGEECRGDESTWGRGMFHKENAKDGVGVDIRLATMLCQKVTLHGLSPILGWVFPTFY